MRSEIPSRDTSFRIALVAALTAIKEAWERLSPLLPDELDPDFVQSDPLRLHIDNELTLAGLYAQRLRGKDVPALLEDLSKSGSEMLKIMRWTLSEFTKRQVGLGGQKVQVPPNTFEKLLAFEERLPSHTAEVDEARLKLISVSGRLLNVAATAPSIVIFSEVHNVRQITERLETPAHANQLFAACIAPLDEFAAKWRDVCSGAYMDSHFLAISTESPNVEEICRDAMLAVRAVLGLSRRLIGHHRDLAELDNKPGIMISVGVGRVIILGQRLQLMVSDGIVNAYNLQYRMKPHQLMVCPQFRRSFLPREFRTGDRCFRRLCCYHGRRYTVYEIDVLGGGPVGLRS